MESLRDMVTHDDLPSRVFRVGVIQSIGDIALLDALRQIKDSFPDLNTQVSTGWGAQLVDKVANGELDAATALFPVTKVLPDGVSGKTLGRIELVVVALRCTPNGSRQGFRLPEAIVLRTRCLTAALMSAVYGIVVSTVC